MKPACTTGKFSINDLSSLNDVSGLTLLREHGSKFSGVFLLVMYCRRARLHSIDNIFYTCFDNFHHSLIYSLANNRTCNILRTSRFPNPLNYNWIIS